MQRTAFFISDRTGITAEVLGSSLLTQFPSIRFDKVSLPFIDSKQKADDALARINASYEQQGVAPLIFSTQINEEYRQILQQSSGIFFDFFATFISKLEEELGMESAHTAGLSHGIGVEKNYASRMESINFALHNDDGASIKNYDKADIILTGVSRSGKTPTCVFLALQYGIYAANYPLTPEDLARDSLPAILIPYKHKLFGLTTEAIHLHKIRTQRRADSVYASLVQCQKEIKYAEELFINTGLPFIDSSKMSIEEIATVVMKNANLTRKY